MTSLVGNDVIINVSNHMVLLLVRWLAAVVT